MTTECQIQRSTKARVAYCPACKIYVEDEREAGRLCPFADCYHTLRLRLGYICEDCECREIFFNRDDYLDHRCEDYGP